MNDSPALKVGDEVADAARAGRPVVALESTIFSSLGLPAPANRECFDRCTAAIRAGGAVPALTGVLSGTAIIGATDDEAERLLRGSVKVAARGLGVAVAERLDVGVTTVSAAVTLAAAAGVEVFATGGIGGVHRGAEDSGDVSHDLTALARHRVVTVSAGAKAFLDLGRTLEYLETLGVPVVGWRTDSFPAFYTRESEFSVPARVDDAAEVVTMMRAAAAIGHGGGILVVNPIPEADELDARLVDEALASGLAEVARRRLRGPEVTPVVLSAIAVATDGDSIPANLALAGSNAAVATEIAVAMAGATDG